ncbi:hypothetical protein MLD38_002966 [Melastoma candidum]|uniref:Uncharacterized protein n=1 Tax=Melastoma candidum TaxID=119954 RepID=A0ACB9S0A1_9MYRT|nr:hypothetical protein MLD38_002966 [Melastoma candidum]
MAAAATGRMSLVGYPFTHAQWKELETQAMIYKYMVASLPVPPDLLIPIITSLSSPPHFSPYHFGSELTLGYGGRADGEPGRCKRTDGKKWRCSREVAPRQKYCDRHLHRGRPRSRKLVEAQASNGGVAMFGNGNARTKTTRSNCGTSPVSFSGGGSSGGGGDSLAQRDDRVPLTLLGDDDNSNFLTLEPSYKETRDVDWLMTGDNPSSASAYNSFPSSSYLGSTRPESFFGTDPPALSSLTLSTGGTDDGEAGSRSADPASWATLAAGGGPLAEALGHRIASMPSDPSSSPNITWNRNDARAFSSFSDSSGASTPTLTASPFTESEFAVRWFTPPNNLASFTN